MKYLSPHFAEYELWCRCCHRCEMTPELLAALEELREAVQRPITPKSGYRCAGHNLAVGGSPRSQHLRGTAADIVIRGYSITAMYAAATKVRAFERGGIGVYPQAGFVHVDVRETRSRWGVCCGQMKSLFAALRCEHGA